MKTRLFLPALLFITMACSDEEGLQNLDSNQATAELNEVASALSDDIITLAQSEGIESASAFCTLLNTSTILGRLSYLQNENLPFTKQQVAIIDQYFVSGIARLLQGEEDFWDEKGAYEWNFELGEFELTRASDTLFVSFPLEGSNINNATLQIDKISFTEIDSEEYPSIIIAHLSIIEPDQDPKPVIALNFSSELGANDTFEEINFELDILPFSFLLKVDESQPTRSSLFSQLLLDGQNIQTTDTEIAFRSEEKTEPAAISGEISYRSLRVVGSLNDDEMDESEDSDPNDYVHLELFIENKKAGDIRFVLEEFVEEGVPTTDYVAYIEYTDGRQEKLDDLFNSVYEEVDELTASLRLE